MAKQPTKQRPVVGDQRTWARPRRLWAIVDDQPDADSAIKQAIEEYSALPQRARPVDGGAALWVHLAADYRR